jgi:hypothetical protein
MWTAARRAASGLPRALKFAGGLFVFDLMYFNHRGHDAPWVGDPKKKTWSWSIEKDPTKTSEIIFAADPERPYKSFPVRVIRPKTTEPHEDANFEPVDAAALESAMWQPWSVLEGSISSQDSVELM